MLSGEKILVTGAAGQIGFPLAEYLARENEVVGVARFRRDGAAERVAAAGITPVALELSTGDYSSLADDFTYVIHLAAFMGGGEDFDKALRINAEGTGLLLAHCRRAKAALVMSTHSIYRPHDDPMYVYDESAALGESNSEFTPTYSMSKIAEEAVARSCARSLGLPTVIARMNASYGQNGGLPAYHLDALADGSPVTTRSGPLPLQPHPPGRHQRPDRGAARRGVGAGHDRQLVRRRAGERAGVVRVRRRADGDRGGGAQRAAAGHPARRHRRRDPADRAHRAVQGGLARGHPPDARAPPPRPGAPGDPDQGRGALMDLQEISDRLEIADLLARYSDAIDNQRWDDLDRVFTPDAVVDYTAFGAPRGNLTETKAFLQKVLPGHVSYAHLLGLPVIDLDGDTARARTPCHNPMVYRDADGKEQSYTCGLWYVDQLVRTPEGWRIAERVEERCHLTGL